MLKDLLQRLFADNGGVVEVETLRRGNYAKFELVEGGAGFVCDKGPVVYLFYQMDELEHEIRIIASHNHGKVYYGASKSRSGVRLGDDYWFETTIDGIMARRLFNKNDGDPVNGYSTYIAALLQKVGFATMHHSDGTDSYIRVID